MVSIVANILVILLVIVLAILHFPRASLRVVLRVVTFSLFLIISVDAGDFKRGIRSHRY